MLLETRGVPFDRKDRNLSFHALQNLICNCFRSGERGCEAHIHAMFLFPLSRERGIDAFLQGLSHDRETVESDVNAASSFSRRFWQTTAGEQHKDHQRN